MASATFVKSNTFFADLASGFHRFASDTYKVCLSDTAVTAATGRYNLVTEIAASGGYVTGGFVVKVTNTMHTSGTYRLHIQDEVITASGAAIPQFRYVILYNAAQITPEPAQAGTTPLARASSPVSWASPFAVVGYYDYGSEVNIPNGSTFTIDFDATNGVFSV